MKGVLTGTPFVLRQMLYHLDLSNSRFVANHSWYHAEVLFFGPKNSYIRHYYEFSRKKPLYFFLIRII